MADAFRRDERRRRRLVRLLVPVTALSGTVYPTGTEVSVRGFGSSVDGFVKGDWLPLSWWEYAEADGEAAPERSPGGSA